MHGLASNKALRLFTSPPHEMSPKLLLLNGPNLNLLGVMLPYH
jgi:hypothetical protein